MLNFPLHMGSPGLLAHPAASAAAVKHLEGWQVAGLVVDSHKAARLQQRHHLGGLGAVVGHVPRRELRQSSWQNRLQPLDRRFSSGSVCFYVAMASKQRLDLELLTRGLVSSRQQAQQLIRAGKVRDGAGTLLDKPGTEVTPGRELRVEQPPRFVSRGGEKLLAGLKAFPVIVEGRVCLDGGISTGGFTDCLLQHGATRVYGVDVGYGQTAWSLRTDERVVLRERTNLRHLQPDDLYGADDLWPSLAVTDVSFISLRLILPALRRLLRGPDTDALVLVKPQFEVGKSRVGKGGVVRDPAAHRDAIESVIAAAAESGWQPQGLVASPITGPAGNHEYVLWLGEGDAAVLPNLDALVAQTLNG